MCSHEGDHPVRTFCGEPACVAAVCTAGRIGDRVGNDLALIAWPQQVSPSPTPMGEGGTGPTAFIVVDADTIRSPVGVKYRLLGSDAPETLYAKCDSELRLGMKAKARLEQLIASGTARIIESGRLDKYRRSLATLTINGEDVAAVRSARDSLNPITESDGKDGAEVGSSSREPRFLPIASDRFPQLPCGNAPLRKSLKTLLRMSKRQWVGVTPPPNQPARL